MKEQLSVQQNSTIPLQESIALICILFIGAFVRLYALDMSPLRWDEVVTPLTARHSLAYIIEWTNHLEPHPPFFHILIKAIMALSQSNWALRLPALLFGVLSILAVYQLARDNLTPRAALWAAAFCAAHPFLILFSRQVRTYSIWTFFFIISVTYLARLWREPSRRTLWKLWAAITGMLLCFNFLSFLLLGVEIPLVLWRLRRRPLVCAIFSLAVAVPALLVSPPLFNALASGNMTTDATRQMFLVRAAHNLSETVLLQFQNPLVQTLIALVCLYGFVRLRQKNKALGNLVAAFFVAPLFILFAIKYAKYFHPWHLIYLAPLTCLCLGEAVCDVCDRFSKSIAVPVMGCLVITAMSLAAFGGKWYSSEIVYEDTYILNGYPVEALSRYVRETISPEHPFLIADLGPLNMLAWTDHRQGIISPADNAAVLLGDTSATIYGANLSTENLAAIQDRLDQATDSFVDVSPASNMQLYRLTLGRRPLAVTRLPMQTVIDANPVSFFRSVTSARLINCNGERGFNIFPAVEDQDGEIVFDLQEHTGKFPQLLQIIPQFHNMGDGNIFEVEARFDAETPLKLLTDAGKSGPGDIVQQAPALALWRFTPYKNLQLTIRLRVVPVTPGYPGGNQCLTALHALKINVDAPELDLLATAGTDAGVALEGLGGIEKEGGHVWRWARGPQSSLTFEAGGATELNLEFTLDNPVPDQTVRVVVNGREVQAYRNLPANAWHNPSLDERLSIPVTPGKNNITFAFTAWNHQGADFAPADPSPLAGAFTRLRLVPQ